MLVDQQSIDLDEIFINLAIVLETEQREKETQHWHQTDGEQDKHPASGIKPSPLGILEHYEDIYAAKQPVAIETLFDQRKFGNQIINPKRLLLLGRAGIGKTTLCRYVAYRWAHANNTQRLWTDRFEYVFYFSLKELVTRYELNESYSLADILYKEVFHALDLTFEQARQFCQQVVRGASSDKVLFVFDGYDEVAAAGYSVIKLLLEQVPRYLITSRPYVHLIQDKKIDLVLETIGFTSDNIKEYITRFFQRKGVVGDGPVLNAWLNANPNVKGLAHVPIHLELLCLLWSQQGAELSTQQMTRTDLYQRLIIFLLKRYVERRDAKAFDRNLNAITIARILQQDAQVKAVITFLSHLAFEGMQTNQLVMSNDLFNRVLTWFPINASSHIQPFQSSVASSSSPELVIKQISATGFLKETADGGYYFLHLSLQEYLAAYHLSTHLNEPSVRQFITRHKYEPYYQIVMQSMGGILKVRPRLLNQFIDWLLQPPRDLYGRYELKLIAQIATEAGWLEALTIMPQLEMIFEKLIEPIQQPERYHDFQLRPIWDFTRLNLIPPKKQPVVVEALLGHIGDHDGFVSRVAIDALGCVNMPADQQERVIGVLLARGADHDEWMRQAAIKAITQFTLLNDQQETVIEILLARCADQESWQECQAAVKALTQVTAPTNQQERVVETLLALSADPENWFVRRWSIMALARVMLPVDQQEEMVETLLELTDHDMVIRIVTIALAKAALSTDRQERMVEIFLARSIDNEKWVRLVAVEALGRVTMPVHQQEGVVEALLARSADHDVWVRKVAIKALAQVTVPAAQQERVFEDLIARSEDQDLKIVV